jgi:hypothetical protein
VADPYDPSDILLMLSDEEARHLACEQIEALFNGGDFDEVTARFKARMAYLRERGAADGISTEDPGLVRSSQQDT